MGQVFVVGALHLDVVVDAPRLPMRDETLMGSTVAYRLGGKGANQAVAAARFGADARMVGCVGSDSFGPKVLGELQEAGVGTGQVRQMDGATGMSVAIVEDTGEYGAVVVSGVNQQMSGRDVDLQSAQIVLLQNEVPEAVNIAAAQKADGGRIILNAAPARKISVALLALTDVLVVNRVEAAHMCGVDPGSLEAKQAVLELGNLVRGDVIVTLGAEGGVLCQKGQVVEFAPPVQATGSAHGAGDRFVGAMAADLAQGSSLQTALRFASTAAAHFVSLPPEDRSNVSRQDVEAWVKSL